MNKVSIIMPIYNVAAQLERAIQSALNQTYSNIEVILINDGSTDKSGEICDEYQRKDKRIKVVHQQNAGSGYARNVGLDIATGVYLYFADPDDYFEMTLIEETVAVAKKNNADMVVFGYYNEVFQKNGQVDTTKKLPILNGEFSQVAFHNQFREHYAVSPYALWNKLYRRDFLMQHNCRFTNQKVGQDALFNQLVQRDVEKVFYHPKAYYHYVSMEGSAVNRYREERFVYEYNIANCFENWMQFWNKDQEYKDLVYREYWGALYLELSNLSWKDSPLTSRQKTIRIATLMKDKKIKEAVYGILLEEEPNVFVKQLLQLLRKEQYANALRLMRIRVVVGKNFQRIFAWLRKKLVKNYRWR